MKLELLTADGEAVLVPGAEGGEVPLEIKFQIAAGRPPGLKPGSPLGAAFTLNFGPLPLSPDQRYEWRLTVDGRHDEDWSLGFTTRPSTPS